MLCSSATGTIAVVVSALVPVLRREAHYVFLASSALTFITGLGLLLPRRWAPRWRLPSIRRPAGRGGGDSFPAQLTEALAGMDPEALRDIAAVIALHREFAAWAVWLPSGRRWIAVRPASGRAAGPDLPMIWVQAGTAADLADRMRAADAQLAPHRGGFSAGSG